MDKLWIQASASAASPTRHRLVEGRFVRDERSAPKLVVYCARCWAHASSAPRLLVQSPCGGPGSRNTRMAQRSRLRSGRHPQWAHKDWILTGPPRPVMVSGAEWHPLVATRATSGGPPPLRPLPGAGPRSIAEAASLMGCPPA